MVSFSRLGLSALCLLQPSLANLIVNRMQQQHSLVDQALGSLQALVQTEDHPSGPISLGCQDHFNVSFAVIVRPANATHNETLANVYHLDGKLYASENREPTEWRAEKQHDNYGGFRVYNIHPSGTKEYWSNSYDNTISLTTSEFSAKQVFFSQLQEADSPESRQTIWWEQSCLVLPEFPRDPLRMLQLSLCDTVVSTFVNASTWKSHDELCKKEEKDKKIASQVSLKEPTDVREKDVADECSTYDNCGGCFAQWRCCWFKEMEEDSYDDDDERSGHNVCSCTLALYSEWKRWNCK